MSGYFYFPNNLKDIRSYIDWYDKLQIFFLINGNSFQRKTEVIATPFYFTVVLGLYLKQPLFQNKLQRTGLESC